MKSERNDNLLTIGDGSAWHFVNGQWQDGENHALELEAHRAPDEAESWEHHKPLNEADNWEHHYAFNRELCYQDVSVSFEFQLQPHSEAGVIFRAGDESHFYLLHFPSCGQACRAQHFWVALSKMDDSGFLKHIKVEMVRRVPSNPLRWLRAEVSLKGGRFTARIGHGLFEAEDDTYEGAGHIGLFTASGGEIRNVVLRGEPAATPTWNDEVTQPQNWFHPRASDEHGRAQQPYDLQRLPGGDLLLTFKAGESQYMGAGILLMTRSSDNGRTWSEAEPLRIVKQGVEWFPARLHVTPQKRLICIIPEEDGFVTAESQDQGYTWSSLVPVNIPANTKNVKRFTIGPAGPINLADGSMLLFVYGGHSLADPEIKGWAWGSVHCQAFAVVSKDDGRTWSEPVNIDNAGRDVVEGPSDGNLDLTEVCGAQMRDGRIMALVRPIWSPWMWETWSEDNGVTWSSCVRGPFPGYATPNMVRTASGHVLVAHRLPSMTVHHSADEGHTWDEGVQIDGSIWLMGAMIEVEPDLVLFTYGTDWLIKGQFLRATANGLEPAREVLHLELPH